MSDRPLSERVRANGWPSWGDLADEIAALEGAGLEVAQDNDRLMGEIRKLEVERDRLRGAITQAFLYAERGAYQRAAEILGAAAGRGRR